MPTQTLTPTIGTALGSWFSLSNALGYHVDGYGAQNSGGGFAALTAMHGRFNLSPRDGVVGFEVNVRARLSSGLFIEDSFTDAAGTKLQDHVGEINAVWDRPLSVGDPVYQKISAAGRAYYSFESDGGYSTDGSEHFLSSDVMPTTDYYVEARIYSATDGGADEAAEIYARALEPDDFYFLQYDEGTNTWNLGSKVAGVRTVLDSYAGDAITVGNSRLARLTVQGTAIKGFVDGVERLSVTDSDITDPGYPGSRLDPGASRGAATSSIVTALYDLGSATVVSRFRRTYGSLWANSYGPLIEASSDGVNWVDMWTGGAPPFDLGVGVFNWYSEFDSTSVDSTAYRYWRVAIRDNGTGHDARIGDFRLYDGGGNLIVPGGAVLTRSGLRTGSTPHNWSEGTSATAFTDNSPGDTSTWVGGSASDDYSLQGLQFDSFEVGGISSGSLNVSLTANGATTRGSAKNVTLTGAYADYTLGSATDLFGASWSIEDVRAETFGILLERGSLSSSVEVDAIRVIIYYNSYGGPKMPLREQVRQQILIGRESGTNEVQTLTITGTPTGGTFRLTFNGVETANIAYNAAAAAVQSALEAISTVGAGNVTCGGGALPGTPVTITFGGIRAAEAQSLITVTTPAFTGGSTPAGSVARTTPGVPAVGAGATANTRLRHVRIQPQPSPEFMAHRPAGEKLTNHQIVLKESSEATIEGIPTYDELGMLLASVIARPATSILQTSVAFRHVFALDNRIRDGIATYQAEYGDQFARAHRVKGLIVNAIDIALRQDGIDLGGSAFAKAIEDAIVMNPGAATVQTLTFSGTGSIRLRWKGQETADLNVATMTSADVQTALRALTGIASSTQLTVTGASSPFTITFGNAAGGPFLGFPQPLLEIRSISGSPVSAIAMTTRGGYTDFPGQVILPRHLEVFLSTTLAAIASSKLTNAFSTGLSIGNKNSPVFNLDRSETSWFNYAESSDLDVKFGLVAEANSSVMSFLPQGRSDTTLFLRILATGGLIGASAFPHRLQIDCPIKVSNFGPFGENQDVYGFEYEFAGVQDDATNTSLVVTLDNGVASY